MEKRGVKLGKAAYQELTGIKKPKLDEQGVLHFAYYAGWPRASSFELAYYKAIERLDAP